MHTFDSRIISKSDAATAINILAERTRTLHNLTATLREENASRRKHRSLEYSMVGAAQVASGAADMLTELRYRGVAVPEIHESLRICRDAERAGFMTNEQGGRLLQILPAVREAEAELETRPNQATRSHYLKGYSTKDLRPENWPHGR